MAIKVAIASSDKTNIDLHFGQASQFEIYELRGNHFEFLETREAPKVEQPAEELSAGSPIGGCGGRFGGGCGSGCGGGCGSGAGGPVSPVVESLLDCRSIVAAQIGQNVRHQFERNAVSVFDIELPIEEALQKLAAYYLKFGE
jgi:predicted Fe-Mo cluster-binding NifX family protein